MTDWIREIEVASALARSASQVVMEIYKKDFTVAYKGINDPVTEADQLANTLIVNGLTTHFPEDKIIAEESPLPIGGCQKTGRCWYVDPLDGTKEFISQNGEFSIMIGLTLDGHTQLGIVYRPTEDHLFVGITDQEAWMEYQGERRRLNARHATSLSAPILVASRSHRSPKLSDIKHALHIREEHPMGSIGLKVGFIASGHADLYMEPGPYTKSWDACAPEAILRGAGGCFTDIHGNPIQYGSNEIRNLHGVLATTRDCHEQAVKSLTGLCATCDG